MGKYGWYAREIANFYAATQGWEFELKACYGLVLDLVYDRDDGRLPDSPQEIAGRLGLSVRKWNTLRGQLIALGKLVVEGPFLVNPPALRRISKRRNNGLPPAENNFVSRLSRDNPEIISRSSEDNVEKNETELPENNGLVPETPPILSRARPLELEIETESEAEATRVDRKITRIAKELGVDLQSSTHFAKWFEQLAEMEVYDKLDFELDIFPAIKARSIPGYEIKSLRLFRPTAVRNKKARERLAAHAANGGGVAPQAKPADMTEPQWREALSHLLRAGLWDRVVHGPTPFEDAFMGPAEFRRAFLTQWSIQGAHPSREYDELGTLVIFPADRPSERCRSQWKPYTRALGGVH